MKPTTYTNAASMPAAGESRLSGGTGLFAYPWPITIARAGTCQNRSALVITDPKHHFRWPGDLPS